MSSLVMSHNLRLMMLEITVKNLFVPWAVEFDKVILKKTTVMFRVLDEKWTPLSPNRRDQRPYRGSNRENEQFHGGRCVIFCVPASFFDEKASDVEIQFCVRKEVSKYFEMEQCQSVGSVAVPIDDLLNDIAEQIRERDQLAEHLSDLYKRQIISRSTAGIYTLLDKDFRNTVATISLYIRISCLGRGFVAEVSRVDGRSRGPFCARELSDAAEEPYRLQHLALEDLQRALNDELGLSRVPRRPLICRCERLAEHEDSAGAARGLAATVATTRDAVDGTKDNAVVARNAGAIVAAIDIADAANIETKAAVADVATLEYPVIPVAKVGARITATEAARAPADYGVPGDGTDADVFASMDVREGIAIPPKAIDNGVDRGNARRKRLIGPAIESKHVEANTGTAAKAKGRAIKDKAEMAFERAFSASGEAKRGTSTAMMGIAERKKRTSALAPSFSHLRTYSLCCRSQPPRLTCFTSRYDLLPCYCHWPPYSSRFFHCHT